jgi:hypothetical protein
MKRKFLNLRKLAVVILLAAMFALYLFVVLNVLTLGKDGLPLGILKGWGDVALHLGMIQVMAESEPFRLDHPAAAGTGLTYPFAINLFSALLQRAGIPAFEAFHVPAFLFAGLLFFAFWLFGKYFLKRDALVISFIAIALFGGGLGFWQFFEDLAAGAPFSHEYTHLDNRTGGKPPEMDAPYNIVWVVPAISFFSHQRTFILGAGLGMLILWGIFFGGKNRWRWLLLAGFLPLAHSHTALAFAMILSVFAIFEVFRASAAARLSAYDSGRRTDYARLAPETSIEILEKRPKYGFSGRARMRFLTGLRRGLRVGTSASALPMLLYGSIAMLIALPQVFYLLADKAGGDFFQWWPGWMAKGQENALWFWTKNFGVVFWGWVIVLIGMSAKYLLAPASAHSSDGRRLLLGAVIRRWYKSIAAAPSSTAPPQLPQDTSRSSLPDLVITPMRASSNHRRAHDNNMMAEGRSPAHARAENSPAVFTALMIASIAIFAAGNLVKFQPWEFDNGKVLLWWWLMAALIALFAIGKIIEARRKLGIALLIVFTFFGTFAGFLDVIGRLKVFPDRSYGYYGAREIQAAEWIRANTAPSDSFLSAGNANDFVPILAGRPLYLGFGGWLWTHGKEELLRERQNAISRFLTFGNQGQLCADGVKYVVWDSQLELAYPEANRVKAAAALEPVFAQEARTIYRLRCINADLR